MPSPCRWHPSRYMAFRRSSAGGGKFGNPGAVKDFYVWIKGSWLFMEIATVLAGIVALRFYRFPFIVALIAVALWFMSMDLTPWVFESGQSFWIRVARCRCGLDLALLLLPGSWIIGDAMATSPSGCIYSGDGVLGSNNLDHELERSWKGPVLPYECRAASHSHYLDAAGLRSFWRVRHFRVSRTSRGRRVQGFAPVSIRAFSDWGRGHRRGPALSSQARSDFRVAHGTPASGLATASPRT